jgi:hypothetical protein
MHNIYSFRDEMSNFVERETVFLIEFINKNAIIIHIGKEQSKMHPWIYTKGKTLYAPME